MIFWAIFPTLAASFFGTFSDPSFFTPQTTFQPKETIYLKIVTPSSGTKTQIFRLLDSQKREVAKIQLARQEQNPYIFTSDFSAPQTSGVYYVDIKIDDGRGKTFSGQRNINVRGSSVSVSPAPKPTEKVPEAKPTKESRDIWGLIRKLINQILGRLKLPSGAPKNFGA